LNTLIKNRLGGFLDGFLRPVGKEWGERGEKTGEKEQKIRLTGLFRMVYNTHYIMAVCRMQRSVFSM